MMSAGFFVLLLSVASVYSQPDQNACDNGGAYDTTTGKATCNGTSINFFDLVCGGGFDQQKCVAKWTNPNGDEEDYFFMGAGTGIAVSDLPASCSSITTSTPLAMVQYYPGNGGCFPAADLQGTQASYTGNTQGNLLSVTLTFAEHDDGSNVRDGYIKITCGAQSGFTTNGDTDVSSKYEVEVTAPCPNEPSTTTVTVGIDAGGIILIIFFVSTLSYFGIGFIVMWKVKNAEGMERIPNKEFWSAQIGNVKEGFRFLKSKITRTDYAPI